MKRIYALILSLCALSLAAQDFPRYGYAPENCAEELRKWQGLSENGYVCGAICLDPAADPAVVRLKGQKVKGVRCYLSHDYAQSRQKRSFVFSAKGSPDNAVQTICDFTAGWNDILFEEPVEIGDEPIYVGLQVYETLAAGHPLGAYDPVSVDGGCWINLKKEGWKNYTDRGTLMIYAILDDEAAPLLQRCVLAQTAHAPLVVEPAKYFAGEVSLHNCSPTTIHSLTLAMQGQGDEEPVTREVTLDNPLGPYEGCVVSMPVRTGAEVGTNQWLRLTVTEVDGAEAQPVRPGTTWHYVTHDAFTRVPLVEEFTSQRCVNCPFMIYYLDKAIEEHTLSDIIYVTHHSGYQDDVFTKPVDGQLLFLFGEGGSYNPAVMYDRLVPVGQEAPVISAKVAEVEPYAEALKQAALRPAMASVEISVGKEGGTVSCHVEGRINSEMAASGVPLYLSVYLIEDSLSADKYPQMGLDDDGAPADLRERFRHNGVIRHNFCTVATGDRLVLGEDNTYSMDYAPANIGSDWVWSNCQVVAFVHKYDTSNLRQNEVLNAGSSRFSAETGIHAATGSATETVRFYTDGHGQLHSSLPVENVRVFTAGGRALRADTSLEKGVYVVTARSSSTGQIVSQKVVVR